MGQIIEALGLNATLVAQIFHFIILLIFLRLVVYPPIVKILEQRQDAIEGNVAAAQEERKQAEALRQQYLDDMQKAKEEANEIIQKATKEAETEARGIIDAAKQDASKVVDERITADVQRDLIDDFIKEAGDLPC